MKFYFKFVGGKKENLKILKDTVYSYGVDMAFPLS